MGRCVARFKVMHLSERKLVLNAGSYEEAAEELSGKLRRITGKNHEVRLHASGPMTGHFVIDRGTNGKGLVVFEPDDTGNAAYRGSERRAPWRYV